MKLDIGISLSSVNLVDSSEYTKTKGVYVGADVHGDYKGLMTALSEALGLKLDADNNVYHCTIMYSRDETVDVLPEIGRRVGGYLCTIQHWIGHNGKTYVVADLQVPEFITLHADLHNQGARHSYAEYRPHITLGKLETLPEDFDAKVEALNWKLKAEPKYVLFDTVKVSDIH